MLTYSLRGRVGVLVNPGYSWERRRKRRRKEAENTQEKEGRARSRWGQADETQHNCRPLTQILMRSGQWYIQPTDCIQNDETGTIQDRSIKTLINWTWNCSSQWNVSTGVSSMTLNCAWMMWQQHNTTEQSSKTLKTAPNDMRMHSWANDTSKRNMDNLKMVRWPSMNQSPQRALQTKLGASNAHQCNMQCTYVLIKTCSGNGSTSLANAQQSNIKGE